MCYNDNAKEIEDHKQEGKNITWHLTDQENLLPTKVQKWQCGERSCGVLISWTVQFILVHGNQTAK
jgi:hypothetical protein